MTQTYDAQADYKARIDHWISHTTTQHNLLVKLGDENQRLKDILKLLIDWGRENTSPLDANSPHELLIEAAEELARADRS